MIKTMEKTLFKNILTDMVRFQIFCPVTGEILDKKTAKLLKHNGVERVVSKNGLEHLKKIKPQFNWDNIEKNHKTYFLEG